MRYIIMLLFLGCCAPCLNAQPVIHNITELLVFADDNSITVKQASLRVAMARQDVRLQSSGLYPKVNVFGTGDYYPIIATQVIPAEVLGGAPGTYLKAQFGLPYIFTAGTEVSMPVINLEKWAQLSKAKAQLKQAEWGSKAAVEQLHLQLIQAYYQLLVTREVMKLNDENLLVAKELMRILEERRKAEVLNPADYNRSSNLLADVNITAVNYERMLDHSANELAAMLSSSVIIEDSLSGFQWKQPSVTAQIEGRPAYIESDARIEVMSLQLLESKRAVIPRLSLNGRYAYNLQSKFEDGHSNVTFDVANIGLRLDVPLFQGAYYRTMQTKSSLQLRDARLQKEDVIARLTQQTRDWMAMYAAAWNKQRRLEQKLAAASDNLRIARLSIKEGVMEFDEFRNIFTEYNRAKLEYIQNLADGILYDLLSNQKF